MRDIIAVELMKLKNSKILWIVTLAPAFMVLQGVINLMRYYDLFTGQGQNTWEQLYTQSMIFYVYILFPVLISLVMTLMGRLENLHQGWKQYLSLPVRKETVYVIKYVLACGLVLVNILALIISMLIASLLIGIKDSFPYENLIVRPLAAYLAAMPLMAILYVLSIRYTQMTVPLGIGIGMTLPAMIVANSKYWIIYPWTYPIMAALGNSIELFNKGPTVYLSSVILSIIVFMYGIRNFSKRDIF